MNLKIIIADDEQGMRLVLKRIIEKVDGFELAGEAKDGETVLRLVEAHRPHVVFLDVEMPVINGVDCAKKIMDINPKTIVIFATAHNEYMPEAFEVYAFDYIIKPFKIDRIVQTLNRIKELAGQHHEILMNKPSGNKKDLSRLVIRNKEGISFVNIEDIILIQREDRSTVIYTLDERLVTSEGLSELEERLDKSLFMRSHKSYIINLSLIHKIYPYGRWTYIIKLKNTDKDALVTHERYEELQEMFK